VDYPDRNASSKIAVQLRTDTAAPRYADLLLAQCDAGGGASVPAAACEHPDIAWARCGAMMLTGEPDGAPQLAPGPFASCMQEALAALRSLTPDPAHLTAIDAAALLSEKAATAGLTRGGRSSPGGSCRLLQARDGWIAANLARSDDRAMVPAWLETEPRAQESAWRLAERGVRSRATQALIERARLMGLAAAACEPPDTAAGPWLVRQRLSAETTRRPTSQPRVLDLSALWAGPLCAHLLERCGADVIKLEATARPDGARAGAARFFDLLNGGKRMCAVDLRERSGCDLLRRLIERVDIVVESSRPRALRQLGIDAEQCVASQPGLTWLSITGYGRAAPFADWVAFGDDAGVAAGISTRLQDSHGRPLFCGDAIADPLTGAHAAVAALAWHRAGGGVLLDVALRNVAAHALLSRAGRGTTGEARVRAPAHSGEPWKVEVGDEGATVEAPRARTAIARAGTLGADTDAVLRASSTC